MESLGIDIMCSHGRCETVGCWYILITTMVVDFVVMFA